MAELTEDPCCAPERRATCCEPAAKADCCGHGETCACHATTPAEATNVRDEVRGRYAAAARALAAAQASAAAPDSAVGASLGCGVPTAVAQLKEGEVVLDLGSGAGADVLISARRVGLTGKAIGLDMTDEMLALARTNARKAGLQNVEFHKGYIEEIPLADASVDVVISNCVLNLSGDKPRVLRETARVLRPGGRLAISDVIADEGMDENTRTDMQKWTGCIAGALTVHEFEHALAAAGLVDLEIRETHRVHDQAAAAIIRARKPNAT